MTAPAAQRRRQQQLARWAKRAPGYQLLVTEVLPRVRRNPVLSDLAWRVFAPRQGAGAVDVPLHGGRYLVGPDLSLLPVVGLVATGLTDEEAGQLVDEVAVLQRRAGFFRPLLVLDRPVFARARAHGFVLELVLPQTSWDGPGSWTDHLADRLAALVDHYQLWHLVVLDGAALDPLTVALLTRLGERLPDDLRVGPSPSVPEEEHHR